jgi:hypothetical protein
LSNTRTHMSDKHHTVSDLFGFLKVVFPYGDPLWVYRGQPDESRPLLPKAGRPEFYDPVFEQQRQKYALANGRDIQPQDLATFMAWRKQAVAYCDSLPKIDLECLAYAQHYGLATRLLDWSSNPLVGLFFAAESLDRTHEKLNGAVFAYQNLRYLDPEKETFNSIQRVCMYKPRPFDRRVLMQDAVFSYHPKPNVPLVAKGRDLVKIIVLASSKDKILRQLCGIGISRKMLFPNVEGLSMFLNWETERAVKARIRSESGEARRQG